AKVSIVIFIDTSAILALAAEGDVNHSKAVEAMQQATEEGESFLVHSYLVSEAASLMQRRLGLTVTLTFLDDIHRFQVHWVDAEDHAEAVALLRTRGQRMLSLVDCASFVIMRRYGIDVA